jgi:hypothetical protein
MCGSTAFKSRTPRSQANHTLRDVSLSVDRGNEYEPNAYRDIAARAKHSFAKSALSGSGEFGARSKRELHVDILGNGDTPAPSEYGGGGAKLGMANAANQMKSASFNSKSAQRDTRLKKQEADKPPPGAYDPSDAAVRPLIRNAGQSFRSGTYRFEDKGWGVLFEKGRTTGPQVGPGHYENVAHSSGARSTISATIKENKGHGKNASFASETARDLNSAYFANERTGFVSAK